MPRPDEYYFIAIFPCKINKELTKQTKILFYKKKVFQHTRPSTSGHKPRMRIGVISLKR